MTLKITHQFHQTAPGKPLVSRFSLAGEDGIIGMNISEYMAVNGSKGGKAGTGKAKAHNTGREHMRKMLAARWAKYRTAQAAKKKPG